MDTFDVFSDLTAMFNPTAASPLPTAETETNSVSDAEKKSTRKVSASVRKEEPNIFKQVTEKITSEVSADTVSKPGSEVSAEIPVPPVASSSVSSVPKVSVTADQGFAGFNMDDAFAELTGLVTSGKVTSEGSAVAESSVVSEKPFEEEKVVTPAVAEEAPDPFAFVSQLAVAPKSKKSAEVPKVTEKSADTKVSAVEASPVVSDTDSSSFKASRVMPGSGKQSPGRPAINNTLTPPKSSSDDNPEVLSRVFGGESKKSDEREQEKRKLAAETFRKENENFADLCDSIEFNSDDIIAVSCFKSSSDHRLTYSRRLDKDKTNKISTGRPSVKLLGIALKFNKPMKIPYISSDKTLETGWSQEDVQWVDAKLNGELNYLTKAELFTFLCSTATGHANFQSGFTFRTESGTIEEGCCVKCKLRYDTYLSGSSKLPTLTFEFDLPSGAKAATNAVDILENPKNGLVVSNLKPDFAVKMRPYVESMLSKKKVDLSGLKASQSERENIGKALINIGSMKTCLDNMYSSANPGLK